MGRKVERAAVSPSVGGAGSPSNTYSVALVEAYLRTKWQLDPSSHLATTDIGRKLWGLPLWRKGSVTAATSFTGANQTLHDIWPSPGLVHYIYIFGGFCPLTQFCQVQTSLCVQVLRSPILVSLQHGTRPAGVSQTLRRGARNGSNYGTFTDGVTYFGWAAITLDIGPHSSSINLWTSTNFPMHSYTHTDLFSSEDKSLASGHNAVFSVQLCNQLIVD